MADLLPGLKLDACDNSNEDRVISLFIYPFLIDFKAKMNTDDDTYDDPEQRPNVYADTGADKDRVKTNSNQTRRGAVQRFNRTFPPPAPNPPAPSELQPINATARMPLSEPPISMAVRQAAVTEDQQRPFSNIYAQTLPDTAVVSDFIIEQRGTITTLIKKLRRITITLAILTILLLATMGVLAYGKETFDSMSEHDHQLQLYGQKRHFSFAIIQVGLSLW